MNRRSFLRSVSVVVVAVLARMGIANAAEEASEEVLREPYFTDDEWDEEEDGTLCFLGTGEWCAYCKDENRRLGHNNCYAPREPEEIEPPCDSCIGLVCSMCNNYDQYIYADPLRTHPGLDAVRWHDMRSWEGKAIPTIIYLSPGADGTGLVSYDSGLTFIECDSVELCVGSDAEWQPAEIYYTSFLDRRREDSQVID